MQEVTVRVPASTSNLGPGFDCFGVALRLCNDVTVRCKVGGQLPRIARATAATFFRAAGQRAFPFACHVTEAIPRARGLGSSATVRVGLLLALNIAAGSPMRPERLLELATELEGHPDNVAPALFGGFNLVSEGGRQRFPVAAALKFVLLVPGLRVETERARALLPKSIAHKDAVKNSGNAAALAAGFATGEYKKLRGAFGDYLHQPFRKKLIPFLDDVIRLGEEAGALGGFLSGSGSTIACVTLSSPELVAAAMLAGMPKRTSAQIFITSADNRGARRLRQ